MLALTGSIHTLFDLRRRFCLCSCTQVLKLHRGNFHHDIDPVKEWTGNSATIILHRHFRTSAPTGSIAVPAALAGIHGTHQHKFSRICHRAGHSGNRHASIFQGLAHHVQGIFPKFRQFIQKQHALVSHGYFTRLGVTSTTGKTGIGNGMVRRTERSAGYQRFFGCQHSHHRIDLADFQCLIPCHIR